VVTDSTARATCLAPRADHGGLARAAGPYHGAPMTVIARLEYGPSVCAQPSLATQVPYRILPLVRAAAISSSEPPTGAGSRLVTSCVRKPLDLAERLFNGRIQPSFCENAGLTDISPAMSVGGPECLELVSASVR
jgi:hypothetical protein